MSIAKVVEALDTEHVSKFFPKLLNQLSVLNAGFAETLAGLSDELTSLVNDESLDKRELKEGLDKVNEKIASIENNIKSLGDHSEKLIQAKNQQEYLETLHRIVELTKEGFKIAEALTDKTRNGLDNTLSQIKVYQAQNNPHEYYFRHTDKLVQGPRDKSEFTRDLEKVGKEFLNNTITSCAYNKNNELIISGRAGNYNLTQILKGKPDFKQLSFTTDELQNYADFILKKANHKPSFNLLKDKDYTTADVPTPAAYAKRDPHGVHKNLDYGEKLAVTLYTDYFYKQEQSLLRNDEVQTSRLTNLKPNDLHQEIKEILLGICVAAHALTKPLMKKSDKSIDEYPYDSIDPNAGRIKFVALARSEIARDDFLDARLKDIDDKKVSRSSGFASAALGGAIQLNNEDTVTHVLQPEDGNARDVSCLTRLQDSEREFILPPGEQLYHTGYKSNKSNENADFQHVFTAIPVHSPDDTVSDANEKRKSAESVPAQAPKVDPKKSELHSEAPQPYNQFVAQANVSATLKKMAIPKIEVDEFKLLRQEARATRIAETARAAAADLAREAGKKAMKALAADGAAKKQVGKPLDPEPKTSRTHAVAPLARQPVQENTAGLRLRG